MRNARARAVPTVALIAVLALAGCTSSSGGSAIPGTDSPSPSPSVTVAKTPTVSIVGSSTKASYLAPIKLVVAAGVITSVQAGLAKGNKQLDGTVAGDGASWSSEAAPKPDSTYRVVATTKDSAGAEHRQSLSFTVAKVPDNQKVAFTVTPNDATTVGIGQPVVVRFLTPVKYRAAMERVMTVAAITPSGSSVTGSWHWLNSQEVHWRPHYFWTPGTKVKLDMEIAGVKAATDRYGRKDYSQTFTIGASHVTKVDGITHRAKVYRGGTLVDDWPTGTGRRGLETYSGTYVVLGKSAVVQMDSCSARITCDKKNPDFYDEKEYWATRVTASGTFLHAASWDGLLGRANVSHGCIHLSDSDAKSFYSHAVVGDIVIVSRTGRGPQQRIDTQDPGLYDWNLSWTAWKAGSAL